MSNPCYKHGTVSVGTTAAVVTNSDYQNGGLLVSNRGPVSVFLGGSTVTADQTINGGLELEPGEKLTIPTTAGGYAYDLYAVTATGTAAVSWLVI